ncbi:hypothetical protein [Nocardioides dilutus]
MPSTRDLLQRFRPAATPGAATATGVPADRREERDAELSGVFAALAATVTEAAEIRRAAVVEAQRRRDRARLEAAARLAQARLDSESLRAQAVAEARDRIESSTAQSRDAAEQRAGEIEEAAQRTRADDVARVVEAVRGLALQPGRAGVAG